MSPCHTVLPACDPIYSCNTTSLQRPLPFSIPPASGRTLALEAFLLWLIPCPHLKHLHHYRQDPVLTHIMGAGPRHGVHTGQTPCLGIQPLTFVASGVAHCLACLPWHSSSVVGAVALPWFGLAWLGVHEPVWAWLGFAWLVLSGFGLDQEAALK